MQVFEFYFNPELKPDLIFDSFCYEPENIYERRVGSLYMVGLLKNVLPENKRLLEELSRVIKEKYYSPVARTPEKSLKESLRRANDFLEEQVKKGNVDWLGNLSFVVCSLKDFKLNFAKVGDIKILLARGDQITDIEQKVNLEDIEPYPLKVFLNIVSGKLTEEDTLLLISPEIFGFLQKENILSKTDLFSPFNEEEFRKILKLKEKKFQDISGVCLVISLSKETVKAKKETVFAGTKKKEFSIKEAFSPILNFFQNIKLPKLRLSTLKIPKIKAPEISKPEIPKLEIISKIELKIESLKIKLKGFLKNKNVILVIGLIFVLLLGSFIFERQEKKRLAEYQAELSQIQEKVNEAESYLILGKTQAKEKANLLFKESFEEISPLVKLSLALPQDFRERVSTLKNKILENLYQLNNVVEIETPELFFEFNPKEFIPQKLVAFKGELYFYSPFSKNIVKIDKKGESQLLQVDKKFNLAAPLENEILFFLKPNEIYVLKGESFQAMFPLETPYSDFNFNSFSTFRNHLYFLDKKAGQIIKYPYLGNYRWDFPQLWLFPEEKRVIRANSLTVDGSIWVLDKNSLNRYYGGKLEESINFNFFPPPKNLTKVLTSPLLPYLYILEPSQKRIIILTKTGEVIKQFQSDSFDNLLDFAVSEDGKTIYLLNSLKVYQIRI